MKLANGVRIAAVGHMTRDSRRSGADGLTTGRLLLTWRIRAPGADLAAPQFAFVHHLRVLRGHARAGAAHVLCLALDARERGPIHFTLKPSAEARNRSGRDGHPHPLCSAQAHCLFRVRLFDCSTARKPGRAASGDAAIDRRRRAGLEFVYRHSRGGSLEAPRATSEWRYSARTIARYYSVCARFNRSAAR